MIKLENGNVKTSGTNITIINGLNNLISHFIKYHPEILLGVFASRDEELKEAVKNCDVEELTMAEFVSTLSQSATREVKGEDEKKN